MSAGFERCFRPNFVLIGPCVSTCRKEYEGHVLYCTERNSLYKVSIVTALING
jgi:hypothetical protein